MSIPVVCPTCDHHFSVREQYAGKRGKCPSCGSVFRAGSASSSSIGTTSTGTTSTGTTSTGTAPKPGFRGGRSGGNSDSPRHQPARRESSAAVADQGDADPFSSGGIAIEDPLSPSARVGGGGGSSGRKRQQGSRSRGGRSQDNRAPGDGAMPVWGWIVMAVMVVVIVGVGAYALTRPSADKYARLQDNLKKSKKATKNAKHNAERERKARVEEDKKKTEEAAIKTPDRYVKSPKHDYDFKFDREVMPAIVKILNKDASGQLRGTGSGFIINEDGWIVTNRHVIEGASQAGIITSTAKEYAVEGVIAVYPLQDLAIIKCKQEILGMKILRLARQGSVFATGMDVWAVGNPGNATFTVTRGIVTRVIPRNELKREGMQYDGPLPGSAEADVMMLEMDARIFPGNSGGPLLNENMEVIGVNTLQGFYPMKVPSPLNPKRQRIDLVPTFGLASHVQYLEKIIEESKDNEVMSFAEANRVAERKQIEGDSQ